MTKVPARPAAVVPPRPAAAPKPGAAAIPAAAKSPATTQSQTVVAPNNPNTNPVAGISTNDGPNGSASAPQVAVNQPATTVSSSAEVAAQNAGDNSGAQVGVPAELTGGVASELSATGAEAASTPNPGKRRGRKPGSGATGGGAPKKSVYPGLLSFNEDGSPVMIDDGKGGQYQQRLVLTEVPTDFDAKKNEKLKPSDFQDEAVYCDFMQAHYAALAKGWEKKAKRIRTMGTATDRSKALKFLKMREEMQKLAEQLRADGMDVDSLDSDDEGEETAAE